MKAFATTLSAALFAQVALAQQWETGSLPKYTSLLGVAATSPDTVYGAVLDNNVGAGAIVSHDYATTGDFTNGGAMNMDVAVSGDNVAIAGFGGIFIAPTSTMAFTKVAGVRTITQSIEPLGNGFAATGQFGVGKDDYNGVCVSTDGVTWTQSDINVDYNLYPARYGAFPSSSTWYVSAGIWPMTSASKAEMAAHLTSRITIDKQNKESPLTFTSNPKGLRGIKADPTGFTGAIAKTTDAGATWSTVYTTDQCYFNQVHCGSETTCMAVCENDDTAFALSTVDGGANWSTVFTGPAGLSLAAVRMLSETEAWIGGGLQTRTLTGYYYHTTDGGANWTSYTSSGYAFDISFSGDVGYSAFLTQSYSSVAVFNKGA